MVTQDGTGSGQLVYLYLVDGINWFTLNGERASVSASAEWELCNVAGSCSMTYVPCVLIALSGPQVPVAAGRGRTAAAW